MCHIKIIQILGSKVVANVKRKISYLDMILIILLLFLRHLKESDKQNTNQ